MQQRRAKARNVLVSMCAFFHNISLDDNGVFSKYSCVKKLDNISTLTPDQKRQKRAQAAAFLERNRGKPQYRTAPGAGLAARKVLRPLSRKFGPGAGQLISHWPEIVGKAYAKLSKPISLKPGKHGNTLLIEAAGPAATLLSANKSQLLKKVNGFLGAGAVSDISVRSGKIATKTAKAAARQSDKLLQKPIAKTPPSDLQSALTALENKVKAKTAK